MIIDEINNDENFLLSKSTGVESWIKAIYKMGEKVFDLFEYNGKRIKPEDNPLFDLNKSTLIHDDKDGGVTNSTEDQSYRMNCFSPDCADFIDDDKKEKLVKEYQIRKLTSCSTCHR